MRYIDTETTAYPISEKDIRAANPNVSFGRPFVPPERYAPVTETTRPQHKMFSQRTFEGTPVLTDGKWVQTWVIEDLPEDALAKVLEKYKTAAIARIEAESRNLYSDSFGWRAEEYRIAAAEAAAYIADGYGDVVPVSVQAWADAKGWTPTEAADDIAKAAAKCQELILAVRTQRLMHTQKIRNAATGQEVADAMGLWGAFVAEQRAKAKA